MIRSFLIAVQFLTRIPVRLSSEPAQQDLARSLLFYPLVGLILGCLLAAFAWLGSALPAILMAAILLAVWVALTGALHLDGLADTADAWAGGHRDPERTLQIMKDPSIGPMGMTAVLLLMLLKFAALVTLAQQQAWLLLAVVPLLGRAVIPLLFMTTPYVRKQGLGSALVSGNQRGSLIAVTVLSAVAVLLISSSSALWLLLTTGLVFVLARGSMQRHIGGTTGDTAGALVELVEAACLLCLAVLVSL